MKKVFIFIISLILFKTNISAAEYHYNRETSYITPISKNLSESLDLKQEKQTVEVKEQTKLKKVLSKISKTPAKISAAFNWVADNLDKILTKKGAIKTLLILGPLFTLYCYFFPPEPVKYLIKKIVKSSVSGGSELLVEVVNEFEENKDGVAEAITKFTQISGELHGIYEANKEIGIKKGLWQSFWNSYGKITAIQLGKAASYGITVGIPFVLTILSKDIAVPIFKEIGLPLLKAKFPVPTV